MEVIAIVGLIVAGIVIVTVAAFYFKGTLHIKYEDSKRKGSIETNRSSDAE